VTDIAVPRPTLRAVATGLVLSLVLCAMNSYLTLSFGVIEEGPTIAALFFFALFFLSRTKITTTEMVIVATMGSAGGSFGFIANFYAAKAMTGQPYTLTQMIAFGVVSSMVGLAMAIPLRELLVIREKMPWPGARAVESVITSLVEHGDRRQPLILLGTFVVACAYVIANTEDGFKLVPAEIAFGGLVAYGGALSLAPFALGGSYLMGFRTCVGFLFGAIALMVMAKVLPASVIAHQDAPHRFYWPGIGFLTASGLTLVAINWRMMVGSVTSLFKMRDATGPGDAVLTGRAFAAFAGLAVVASIAVLIGLFDLPILVVLVMIAVAGLLQNIISTRAQAQTNFNPARVMGILTQGVAWLVGGSAAAVNLTGAGFVAGSGGQAGMLTSDMAYGRHFKTPPRWQFVTQCLTVIPCAVIAALVFQWIAGQKPMTLDTAIAAPVAKAWAAAALIFEGKTPMPHGALEGLLIGGGVGVIYTLLEQKESIRDRIPCSVGFGIGLVLPAAYGFSFFLGGFLQWIVLGRWLGWSAATLTTLSVGCIVAEGIGGVLKALLAAIGVL
jgi:uncharacterized oligopeptide transporter (OPT) family protein